MRKRIAQWWNAFKNRKNKPIRNYHIKVTDGLGISAYSTILDMKGNCKQEGVVLTHIQKKSRCRAENIPLMYGDSPQEVLERIRPSLVLEGQQ